MGIFSASTNRNTQFLLEVSLTFVLNQVKLLVPNSKVSCCACQQNVFCQLLSFIQRRWVDKIKVDSCTLPQANCEIFLFHCIFLTFNCFHSQAITEQCRVFPICRRQLCKSDPLIFFIETKSLVKCEIAPR